MKTMAGWVVAMAVGGAGGVMGCSADAKDTPVMSLSQVQGAITVASSASLPNCNPSNRGAVYFVTSDASLLYCDGRDYRPVDTTGLRGKDATSWLVTVATSDECPAGGVSISVGPDANRDGVIDAPTSTTRICNGANGTNGTNGTNGHDSLIAMTDEPAGANCAAGGTKIVTGLDANGNGTLDDSEITQTKYVCTGVAAAPAPKGPKVVGVMWVDGLTGPETTPGFEGAFDLYDASYGFKGYVQYSLTGTTLRTVSDDLIVTTDAVQLGGFAKLLPAPVDGRPLTVALFLGDDGAFIGLRFEDRLHVDSQEISNGRQQLSFSAPARVAIGGGTHASPSFASALTIGLDSMMLSALRPPSYGVPLYDTLPVMGGRPVVLDASSTFSMLTDVTALRGTTVSSYRVDLHPLAIERQAGAAAITDLKEAIRPTSDNLAVHADDGNLSLDATSTSARILGWSLATSPNGLREKLSIDVADIAWTTTTKTVDGQTVTQTGAWDLATHL